MAESCAHWSVGHDDHTGGIPGFGNLVVATLASTRGLDTETYDILPNFTFDHAGMVITSPASVAQGRLLVRRRRTHDATRFDVKRYDRTSGVTLEASFVRTTAPDPVIVSSRRSTRSAHDAGMPGFDRAATVECPAATVIEYELFERLPEMAERGATFRLRRLDGGADVTATVHMIDETVMQLNDAPERISMFALLAAADVPSIWWIDERRRVLLVVTTLWTLVMTGESTDDRGATKHRPDYDR